MVCERPFWADRCSSPYMAGSYPYPRPFSPRKSPGGVNRSGDWKDAKLNLLRVCHHPAGLRREHPTLIKSILYEPLNLRVLTRYGADNRLNSRRITTPIERSLSRITP